jgi:hypothetical protein
MARTLLRIPVIEAHDYQHDNGLRPQASAWRDTYPCAGHGLAWIFHWGDGILLDHCPGFLIMVSCSRAGSDPDRRAGCAGFHGPVGSFLVRRIGVLLVMPVLAGP